MGFAKIQVYTCVFLFSSRLSALDERFFTRLRGKAALSDLKPSGLTLEQVAVLVLTHLYGDHVGGLMVGDTPTLPPLVTPRGA